METLVRHQNINIEDIYKKKGLSNNKLMEFDKEQTVDYAFMNALSKEITKEMLGIINDTNNITELLTRSILSKMIKNTFPSLKDKMEINVAGLYQAYTDKWINREDNRSQMTYEGLRRFIWQLALKISQEKSGLSLHYSKLDKPKREHLKEHFTATDKDYYQYEATKCPFLYHDENGYYGFTHKSFMDFFLAQYFFHELKNNNRITNAFDFNHETRFFLKSIILLNKSSLHGLDLSGLLLNNINLEGVNLTKTNLSECRLIGAKLKMARLCEADLSKAILCGADLSNVNLSGANLYKTDLSNADMCMSNLNSASFQEANLCMSDLTLAKLNCTDFSNANLSEAILCKTELTNAKLKKTKLCDADLSLATLSGNDLSGIDLERVNFHMANLCNTNLKGANLKDANLRTANCNGAIFD